MLKETLWSDAVMLKFKNGRLLHQVALSTVSAVYKNGCMFDISFLNIVENVD